MKVREALITQSPSLALQRAALDEIAWLDAEIARLEQALAEARGEAVSTLEIITPTGS